MNYVVFETCSCFDWTKRRLGTTFKSINVTDSQEPVATFCLAGAAESDDIIDYLKTYHGATQVEFIAFYDFCPFGKSYSYGSLMPKRKAARAKVAA